MYGFALHMYVPHDDDVMHSCVNCSFSNANLQALSSYFLPCTIAGLKIDACLPNIFVIQIITLEQHSYF